MVVAQGPKETEGVDGENLSKLDGEAAPQEGDTVRNLQSGICGIPDLRL